nr:MAG TPA: hypothetical protein [Caudoviricetes sp.]
MMHPIDQLDMSNPDVLMAVVSMFMKLHRDVSMIHVEKIMDGSAMKINIEITEGKTIFLDDKKTN